MSQPKLVYDAKEQTYATMRERNKPANRFPRIFAEVAAEAIACKDLGLTAPQIIVTKTHEDKKQREKEYLDRVADIEARFNQATFVFFDDSQNDIDNTGQLLQVSIQIGEVEGISKEQIHIAEEAIQTKIGWMGYPEPYSYDDKGKIQRLKQCENEIAFTYPAYNRP